MRMSDYGTGRKTYVRELDTVNPSSDAMATVCITNDIIEVKVYERGFHKDIGRFNQKQAGVVSAVRTDITGTGRLRGSDVLSIIISRGAVMNSISYLLIAVISI